MGAVTDFAKRFVPGLPGIGDRVLADLGGTGTKPFPGTVIAIKVTVGDSGRVVPIPPDLVVIRLRVELDRTRRWIPWPVEHRDIMVAARPGRRVPRCVWCRPDMVSPAEDGS